MSQSWPSGAGNPRLKIVQGLAFNRTFVLQPKLKIPVRGD